MAGECLPHKADLPTTPESTSCPPSIPGGCSLSGHSWSPSKVQCLHGFHLSTFGDLVSWNRLLQRWDWRKVNPPRLCKALQTHLPSRPVWWLISCLGKRGISPLLVSSQQRLRSRKFRTLPALPPKRRTLSRSFATASTFSFQRILLHKGPSSAAPPGYKFITAPLRPNIGSQRSLVLLTPELPSSHSSPSKETSTLGGVTSSTLPLSSHYRKQYKSIVRHRTYRPRILDASAPVHISHIPKEDFSLSLSQLPNMSIWPSTPVPAHLPFTRQKITGLIASRSPLLSLWLTNPEHLGCTVTP